ncbi:MAG: VCBS domain-containing protein, partial [Desulfovibrionaceae bacterium]|nr:VCBS domain-containing protein [Desulfovibrionaceae bacterium]
MSISVADGIEADGGTVAATITLSQPPTADGQLILTLPDGSTKEVALVVGQSEYVVDVPHGNDEDIYLDASDITVSVELEGGGYARPVAGASDSAHIADTIDTTTAEIASVVPDGHGGVIVTVQLSNPISAHPAPQTDITISVVVDGVTQYLTIPAGSIGNSITFDNVLNSSPYAGSEQKVTVSLGVDNPNAGNFEELVAQPGASFEVSPPSSEVTMSISVADGIEADGGTVAATITLSQPPTADGQLILTLPDGSTKEVALVVGQSEYVVDVPHGNDEDIYLDASDITVSVELEGGGYARPVAGASDSAHIADTIDTTTASITLGQDENNLLVTISLTAPGDPNHPEDPAVVTFTINGVEYSYTFGPGETQKTLNFTDYLKENATGYQAAVDAKITAFTGGNYEDRAGVGAADNGSFTVIQPPVANPDFNTIIQDDGSVRGNLFDNDQGNAGAAKGSFGDSPNEALVSVNGVLPDPDTGIITVQGEYGTLTVHPDGNYEYAYDPANPDVTALFGNNFSDTSLPESFTYIIRHPGGEDSSTLDITLKPSVFLNEGNADVTLQGGQGHDVVVGDYGGVQVGAGSAAGSYNMTIILDNSWSMSRWGGTAFDVAKLAVLNLSLQYAQHGSLPGAEVNLAILPFNTHAGTPITSENWSMDSLTQTARPVANSFTTFEHNGTTVTMCTSKATYSGGWMVFRSDKNMELVSSEGAKNAHFHDGDGYYRVNQNGEVQYSANGSSG